MTSDSAPRWSKQNTFKITIADPAKRPRHDSGNAAGVLDYGGLICRSIGVSKWEVSCIDQYVSDGPWQTFPFSGRGGPRRRREITAMEYPHWLILAGALLLMLGFLGLALRRQSDAADPSEMASNQATSEPEDSLKPLEVYNRTAKGKRRDRWAERAAPIGSGISP
jgi:hypothetical protein